jgi:predicted nucleic acid-binding protein
MRLFLDSTFLIDHLRGDEAARGRFTAIFERGDEPFINEVVVCEVRAGLRAEHEPLLLALIQPIEYVQGGPEVALDAGRWRADVRAQGRHLGLPDALIAASAHNLRAAVLTRNVRDFALTPVRVETY